MKKCSKCGRVMTDDECGDEFPEERVCDQCAGITREVNKNQLTDEQIRDLEFKLAHGVLMSRDEWELSIHLVNEITGRNDVVSDEGYEAYAAEV